MMSWASVVALALLAGCASTSPKAAFEDTASLVEARTGRRITWNRGTAEDEAVAKQVRALLARDLTVNTAVEIALLNNPTLQATYEDLTVAQADLVQAGLLQNPVLGAGVAFPVAGSAQTGVSVSVSQDFLSVFTLAARKKVARAELEATRLRVGDAVLRATCEVETAYYALAAAQQVAAMRRRILAAADATVDLARRQRDAGDVSDLDLAGQEALSEQVRTDVTRSEADVVGAREALTRWLGVWDVNLLHHVPEKLPELPTEEAAEGDLESVAVKQRLDLGAAREESEAAEKAYALAKSFRWLGGTSVGATYDKAPEGFTTVGPNVGLELPIFDQKQAVVARFAARLRVSRARQVALEVLVRSEVRAAESRVLLSRALVERYAKVVVPLRERVVALSQEHYNAMLIGTAQLLQAKQSEVNAYRELIEILRDYWTARADLERATGGAISATPVEIKKP
jgi:cobalt-zinc-cadmium efflux system outer membrane protein